MRDTSLLAGAHKRREAATRYTCINTKYTCMHTSVEGAYLSLYTPEMDQGKHIELCYNMFTPYIEY